MNDIALDLPTGGIDRSVNVLLVPIEGAVDLVLTIAREPRTSDAFAEQAGALVASVNKELPPDATRRPRWGSVEGRAIVAVELRVTTERGAMVSHHVLIDGGDQMFALALTGPAELALRIAAKLDVLLAGFVVTGQT